jgi:hypothetical protein
LTAKERSWRHLSTGDAPAFLFKQRPATVSRRGFSARTAALLLGSGGGAVLMRPRRGAAPLTVASGRLHGRPQDSGATGMADQSAVPVSNDAACDIEGHLVYLTTLKKAAWSRMFTG